MLDKFFLPVLRVTVAEIAAATGWLVFGGAVLAMYFGAPFFLPTDGGSWVFASNQAIVLVTWASGLYSIALAGKFGAAQVSRGGNLFFRAMGSSDIQRLLAVSLGSTMPLAACLALDFVLLAVGQWLWNGSLWGGLIGGAQFVSLFYLPFLASAILAAGVGSFVSGGAGAVVGTVFYLAGTFLPPLLSIAADLGPVWIEALWAVCPHFYALDWSPAAIYLWEPANGAVFGAAAVYGMLWTGICFGLGGVLFTRSESHYG